MKRIYTHYIIPSIVIATVCILLGIFIWQHNIEKVNSNQRHEISEIVSKIVREQANTNLLPDIIFIQADSSIKTSLKKNISSQIADILTKKYLTHDTLRFNDLTIKPFFINPKQDRAGNYILTEFQFNEIKGHIDFLIKQVDVEVEKAKEENGKEIDRLNTWVSIWIGVIGFLGIFIPIIINVDASRSAEKAEEALGKINNAKPQIDKIDGIEQKINTAEEKLAEVERKTSEAEGKVNNTETKLNETESKISGLATRTESAQKSAEKTEQLLMAFNAINNLKNIDISLLQVIRTPEKFLGRTLDKIHMGLTNCKDHFEEDVIKEWVGQLAIYLHLVSLFRFVNHDNTARINSVAVFINDTLLKKYDRQNFQNLLSQIKELSNHLIS